MTLPVVGFIADPFYCAKSLSDPKAHASAVRNPSLSIIGDAKADLYSEQQLIIECKHKESLRAKDEVE